MNALHIRWLGAAASIGLATTFCIPVRAQAVEPAADKCKSAGMLQAGTWHKLDVCVGLYPALVHETEITKTGVTKRYPKFFAALTEAEWATLIKDVGVSSTYEHLSEDPKFSAGSCRQSLELLKKTLFDPAWESVFSCWK